MKASVSMIDGGKAETIELSDEIFQAPVRRDLIGRMVRYQLAKRQSGTHKAQTRGEVSRSGSKLYNQKGGGRARHGSRRANVFRGGGVVFGPVVRDHAHRLPRKVRRIALISALSAKQAEGRLLIVDKLDVGVKTGPAVKALQALGISQSVVLVPSDEHVLALRRATGNLPRFEVLPVDGVNVYDLVRREQLVVAKDAVIALSEKLVRPIVRTGGSAVSGNNGALKEPVGAGTSGVREDGSKKEPTRRKPSSRRKKSDDSVDAVKVESDVVGKSDGEQS